MTLTFPQAKVALDARTQELTEGQNYAERLRSAVSNARVAKRSGVLYGIGEYHTPNLLSLAIAIGMLPNTVECSPDQSRELHELTARLNMGYAGLGGTMGNLELRLLNKLHPDLIYSEGKRPGVWGDDVLPALKGGVSLRIRS